MSAVRAAAFAALLALASPLAAQTNDAPSPRDLAEPIQIRNLNPLVGIFGLPAWDVATRGSRFAANVDVANHYVFSQEDGQLLVLDGETFRTTFAYSKGFDRWMIGAELPWFHVGGGVLDDVIDGWHSAFNLPDGGRSERPEGELLFLLGDANGRFFRLDEPRTGFGDLQLKAARALGPREGFVVEAGVKLATGDEDLLAGSGSTDWWLTVLRARPLRERTHPAGYYWGFGVIEIGTPTLVDFPAERRVYTAIVGGSWQRWRRFGLKAQLDYHRPFYRSPLEEIGEAALEATAGAWMIASERARLEFAVVEDLHVSTAPDVVMRIGARWTW